MDTITFAQQQRRDAKLHLVFFFCALALVAWIATLLSGGVVASRVPVSLRCGANAEQVGDYVFASGTWVIEGDKQTFPLQTAEIQCDRHASPFSVRHRTNRIRGAIQ